MTKKQKRDKKRGGNPYRLKRKQKKEQRLFLEEKIYGKPTVQNLHGRGIN